MINEAPHKKEAIVFGNDSVVIQKYIAGITGGRTLDVANAEDIIYAGHVIVVNAEGVYRPLETEDDVYVALGEGESYAGVLYRSIRKADPQAAIMTVGVVNRKLLPYPLPDGFLCGITQSEDIIA